MRHLSRTHQVFIVVLAIAISLALVACGGGSAASPAHISASPTSTVTPTLTPTTIPTLTFNSPSGLYSLTYLGSWTAQGGDAGNALFASPNRQDELNLLAGLTPANWTDIQYSNFLSQFLGVFGMSQVTISDQPGSAALGANTWKTFSATGMYKGVAYTAAMFGLSHGATTFLAIATAPSSDATNAGTIYFQPMITSLVFLK